MAETQICAFMEKRAPKNTQKTQKTERAVLVVQCTLVWPGIRWGAERETGSKLEGSLRLIAGTLLIIAFSFFFQAPIPASEGWLSTRIKRAQEQRAFKTALYVFGEERW